MWESLEYITPRFGMVKVGFLEDDAYEGKGYDER